MSFGTKLLLTLLLVSGVTVSFVCAAMVINGLIDARRKTLDTLGTYADMIGRNTTAAIMFDDPEAGHDILSALRAVPAVMKAEILRPDGSVFAEYAPPAAADAQHETKGLDPQPGEFLTRGSVLALSRTIAIEGEPLGRIRLYYDMQQTYAEIRNNNLLALAVGGVAMIGATALGSRVRKRVSQPVGELVRVSRAVCEHQDYSQRARHDRADDVGQVMDAFNSMLSTIELRQEQLQRAHDHLEQRVRERTADLEVARLKAEAANRSKTNFLANMSHEIRTPMTAILGFSEMLLDPDHSQSLRLDSVLTIHRNGKHLLGLINDILDISKIEAGKMTMESRPTPLVELVADVASLIRLRAGEKGLSLHVEYLSAVPQTIRTDPTRLRQVLANLLGNAVKFTERGSVTLRVRLLNGSEYSEPKLQFAVVDTGIGIAADNLEKLFVPFTQADESVTRRFGGTGLGLAISRQLVHMLGGDITVDSRPGHGSTFTVTISIGSLDGVRILERPCEIEAECRTHRGHEDIVPAPQSILRGRVLVAEDGIDNQRLVRAILTAKGIDVTVVENGRLACEEVERADAAGAPFALVFMDMQMPEMDGYTAARRLRDQGSRIPIVALTAHALAGDRERCMEAGCDDYLTKPIDRRRLVEFAAKYLSNWSGSPPDTLPPEGERSATGAEQGASEMLHSELADDPVIAGLLVEFLNVLPERLHEIHRAATDNDLTTLAMLAHKLGGAGGGFGYPPITEAARTLERLSKESADLEAIRASISDLTSICERARRAGLCPFPSDRQP